MAYYKIFILAITKPDSIDHCFISWQWTIFFFGPLLFLLCAEVFAQMVATTFTVKV
jgi:hypothetical protein